MEAVNETYTIKEVAEITGFKPHVIRYYEKEFNLNIPRTNSNRRYFTNKETAQFQYIKELQKKGLNNKQIKKILKSSKNPTNEIETLEFLEPIDDLENKDNILNTHMVSEIEETSKKDLEERNIPKDEIYDLLNDVITLIKELNYKSDIKKLVEKFDDFKEELSHYEKDILITENAKLKMKIKERSYEIAELKEKLKREQFKKRPFFTKLFSIK
ncbi:MAG: MerR family transcriptional regulator [Clostridiales bacterium]|nr:MerR family transcriptional regulator [Clostridiales bacterium]